MKKLGAQIRNWNLT